MSELKVSKRDYELLIWNRHPEFERVGDREFQAELDHMNEYKQKIKRKSDNKEFLMIFCMHHNIEEFEYIEDIKGCVQIDETLGSKYDYRGNVIVYDHPLKPDPKTALSLRLEKIRSMGFKKLEDNPNIPPEDLFALFDVFGHEKRDVHITVIREACSLLALNYHVDLNSIFNTINNNSKRRCEFKKEYTNDFLFHKNGLIEYKLKSGKVIELTKNEYDELKRKL